jgi:protein O-GlcNAc transferase
MTTPPQQTMSLDVALQQAVEHHRAGRFQEAQNFYSAILHADPRQADANHNLGVLAGQIGQLAAGLPHLKLALDVMPGNEQYSLSYAEALLVTGQVNEALNVILNAEKRGLNTPSILGLRQKINDVLKSSANKTNNQELSPADINQLVALFGDARYAEMENQARSLLQRFPDVGMLWKALSASLQSQGKESLTALQKTVELLPDDADAHSNLGIALAAMGRLEDAVKCYRRAIAINPDLAAAHSNLGIALTDLGQIEPAIISCRRALELHPDSSEIHSNLGNALKYFGQLDKAIASYRRALEIKSDDAAVHSNLGSVLKDAGHVEAAIASCQRALQISPNLQIAFDNLLFIKLYQSEQTTEEMSTLHSKFDAVFGLPHKGQTRFHSNLKDENKRLKIGYVSADFRSHAVATFMEPILACHAKSRIEVYCYYNHSLYDDVSTRIHAHADHWVPCIGLNDDQLAERIRDDGIDILVDLSGHTEGNRLLTFARKPAPVQMTYLGYPGTSGLSAIDYRISDGYSDPSGSDKFYSEQLLRLPDSLCCYRPVIDMPAVSTLPALTNGFVTFGSLNNSNKIDQHVIALWARILVALPTSRLLMATIPEGDRRTWILKQFELGGVSSNRIDFYGTLSIGEFHRLFQRVDIALDPLLITGGTTTCESLWMGVPVVVLIGERFLRRVGYSFLCSAGLPQFGAKTADEYVGIAVETAKDLRRLSQLRTDMRTKLTVSPLMDQVRFTQNLENLYRDSWKKWCDSNTSSFQSL